MSKAADVTLAILAGGRARRLAGMPKGLLCLGGETLVERLHKLSNYVAEVLLVTNDEKPYERFGIRMVRDLIPDRGAPGGVHAALCQVQTRWILAVGCDMPFVDSTALEALLSHRSEGSEIVAFQNGDRIEPLFALYRAEMAPRWARLLPTSPSFSELYLHFRITLLSTDALRRSDPSLRIFANVNAPPDVETFGLSLPNKSSRNRS